MTKEEIVVYAKKASRVDKDTQILSLCKDRTVLDVGCIGQDRNFNSDNWLHNKLRKVASYIDGVDINKESIELAKQSGYSMYLPEELETSDKSYDTIVMADVIEHVNNPVDFLTSYSKYLNPSGVMVVSTPNSNRANNFVNILFNNNYSVNPEHTFWFCPRTLGEVIDRAGLNIQSFYWVEQYYTSKAVKGAWQKFKFHLTSWLIRRRTNFSPNMIMVVSK